MNTHDTIIAPATAEGEAGIAVLRISGAESLPFIKTYFKPKKKHLSRFITHHLYLGYLLSAESEVIDEVMVVYMQPLRSYTYEHVVEIQCHGSRQVIKKILSLALDFGIRLAGPGEFTYRAFINGRLDLSQAESVSRLISSRSEFSRKAALYQLEGFLQHRISDFSTLVKQIIVHLEAWIDFPEDDIPSADIHRLISQVADLIADMSSLADTYQVGRVAHDGASVVIVGLPNVGKSSLLNALLNRERAIVSEIPGTTRDVIEESLQVDGILLRLADTAGLRDSLDIIEQEGVRRSYDQLHKADLVLLLHDSTTIPQEPFLRLLSLCNPQSSILVLTKSDLESVDLDTGFFSGSICSVSSHTGDGLDNLKRSISSLLFKNYQPEAEPAYITERRHYESLMLSIKSLEMFVENCDHLPLDLIVVDLRDALSFLGQIIGHIPNDSILEDIFSSFCIGK